MKWTSENDAKLRELAPLGIGSPKIAKIVGHSRNAVCGRARRQGITIVRANHAQCTVEQGLSARVRARWALLLPAMKEQLRADIGSMS